MNDHKKLTGACLCDAVRFEARTPSLWCAHCHCRMCQRAHGAAFVTWVGVATDGFRVTHGESSVTWFASSADSERGFCQACGTTLFFRSQRWPGEVHIVRTGFDGDIDREPDAHVHFESHVAWFPITDDLPRKTSAD